MSAFIPYGRQSVDEEDIRAVVDVLRSDWLTQGPAVERFEKALADYCDAKYAVAVASGTAALHLACLAAGVAAGDTVITSPLTFVASANCALYVGAEPRFADIDPQTHNISLNELRKAVAPGNARAVVPVDFAGLPCDMEAIQALAAAHGLTIIEDACHALGAQYRTTGGDWVKVGSGRHSDMTVFSFHPVKSITTGEGGAITTNSAELCEKLKTLRAHGIIKDAGKLASDQGPWYYEMRALGYNYRITDFQCALGVSQLTRLDDWLVRRAAIADQYDDAFSGVEAIGICPRGASVKSANHLYVIEVDNRNEVFRRLRQAGLGVQVHYIPVHLQPYYRQTFGYVGGEFPAAEAAYTRSISIPIYPKMTNEDVDQVIAAVLEAVEKRSEAGSP